MSQTESDPPILWSPDRRAGSTEMQSYLKHVQERFDLPLDSYSDLHRWSVTEPEAFWEDLFCYFDFHYEGSPVPPQLEPGFIPYTWFPNVRLNFAENLLTRGPSEALALIFRHESGLRATLSYQELNRQVAAVQGALDGHLKPGQTVAAYMPNIPETVIAMLATTASGGVFTSTSCDFGAPAVLDRFQQSRPQVLVTVPTYTYQGRTIDLRPRLREIVAGLPSVQLVILIDFLGDDPRTALDLGRVPVRAWQDILTAKNPATPHFVRLPFGAPLYILYSSGTTGKPKCIIHSVGGTLLQHTKELRLHTDLTPGKRIFYFTTCGWMMWNWLVSGLACGSTVVLYEGSPSFPSIGAFLNLVSEEDVHIFGTSPKFLRAAEQTEAEWPKPLDSLECILCTGSPLLPEQFDYVYRNVPARVRLSSIAGGTDLLGCFVIGNPLLPVKRGYIQGPALGMDVACVDDGGQPIVNHEGELVCRQAFPSVPIGFLGDPNHEKFKSSYFEKYPGFWHHGDYIKMTADGQVQIFGRSDATLNPGGVRIGTAEIYRQIEGLPYLVDALCVSRPVSGDVEVVLFVKLSQHESLTDLRIQEIKTRIRQATTPRHVPTHIVAVRDIPYTQSGKKVELAVSRLLAGQPVTNKEALVNPHCLEEFESWAKAMKRL